MAAILINVSLCLDIWAFNANGGVMIQDLEDTNAINELLECISTKRILQYNFSESTEKNCSDQSSLCRACIPRKSGFVILAFSWD